MVSFAHEKPHINLLDVHAYVIYVSCAYKSVYSSSVDIRMHWSGMINNKLLCFIIIMSQPHGF